VLTGVAVALMALLGVPLLIAVALVAGAAVVFVVVAAQIVRGSEMFKEVTIDGQETIIRWCAAAAIIHVVWALVFLIKPDLWFLWLGGLAAVALLEYWVARMHEYMLTQIKPKAQVQATQTQEDTDPAGKPIRKLREAFTLSGHDYLTIMSWEPILSGDRPVGVRYRVRIPPKVVAASKGNKTGTQIGKLSGEDVEPIAIAMSQALQHELETDWVHITKEPAAGTYSVAVLQEDVMATIYPYIDKPEWKSIKDPALAGYDIDGKPHYQRVDQHGADVGMSTWGKTAKVHVKFAHTTLCDDGVQWVSGVEKLYDLVGPWIEPYMGADLPLPFDAIGSGPQDTAEMLAAGMRIARWRQQQPHHLRKGFKKIIIELDEASFALPIRTVTAMYEGHPRTLTELAEMIVKGAGSGGVHLHLAAQRGTHGNWGDKGGDINAGLSWQTVFRTKDPAEIGRATGDYKLPMPRHKGEHWLEPGDGSPTIKLKAPYIQETDPQREKLHNGATITDVAWARRHFHTSLDEGSARAAGEWYANRHTRATPELFAYLTGNHPVPEHSSAFADAREQVEAEIQAKMAAAGWQQAEPTVAASVPSGGVSTMVGRRTRAVRIVDIVRGSTTPMSPADIIEALRSEGDSVTNQVVTNALNKLVQDKALRKPARGEYIAL
jgi:hypothetical protein